MIYFYHMKPLKAIFRPSGGLALSSTQRIKLPLVHSVILMEFHQPQTKNSVILGEMVEKTVLPSYSEQSVTDNDTAD